MSAYQISNWKFAISKEQAKKQPDVDQIRLYEDKLAWQRIYSCVPPELNLGPPAMKSQVTEYVLSDYK